MLRSQRHARCSVHLRAQRTTRAAASCARVRSRYYSHRYYFKHFTNPAAKPLRDAIAYVKATWPQHWARKGGRDHIMVMTQDQGNRYAH